MVYMQNILRYFYGNNYVYAFGKRNKFLFQFYLNNASGFTYQWQLTVTQIHLIYLNTGESL